MHTHANLKFAASTCVDAGDRGLPFANANIVLRLQTRIRKALRSKQHGKACYRLPAHDQFRLTDEAWLGIQKEIAGSELTVHEWCRKAALERLNNNYGFSKAERLLLEHFVRAQYLVTQGFQLLADDNLTGDQWKKFRAIATERASELTDNALALRAPRSRERSR